MTAANAAPIEPEMALAPLGFVIVGGVLDVGGALGAGTVLFTLGTERGVLVVRSPLVLAWLQLEVLVVLKMLEGLGMLEVLVLLETLAALLLVGPTPPQTKLDPASGGLLAATVVEVARDWELETVVVGLMLLLLMALGVEVLVGLGLLTVLDEGEGEGGGEGGGFVDSAAVEDGGTFVEASGGHERSKYGLAEGSFIRPKSSVP